MVKLRKYIILYGLYGLYDVDLAMSTGSPSSGAQVKQVSYAPP